jgi:hypothetical protein
MTSAVVHVRIALHRCFRAWSSGSTHVTHRGSSDHRDSRSVDAGFERASCYSSFRLVVQPAESLISIDSAWVSMIERFWDRSYKQLPSRKFNPVSCIPSRALWLSRVRKNRWCGAETERDEATFATNRKGRTRRRRRWSGSSTRRQGRAGRRKRTEATVRLR